MSYTTSANVSDFLQKTLSDDENASLSGFILSAVDSWIDRYLQTTFASVSATTRLYDGGVKNLDIDPCSSITSVKSLNTDGSTSYDYDLTVTPDVVFEPANETIKREIRKRNGTFPSGMQNIAVAAKFTEYDFVNSQVPSDIILVATRLASGIVNSGKVSGAGGNIQSESLEGHSITYDTNADTISELAANDPIIMNVLGARREPYV